MPYLIQIRKSAQKQLDKLSDDVADELLDAIEGLAANPRPSGCKKLKGREGYRIRKGDYRIIYNIFDNVLTIDIVAVGHRREIYD
ncbi:MAG: type II toxin-antitoxin system RelE/ParE family toxin [Saprospiraceae bacterium]|nr:type II toxin-antitoxin system RelE/ParE family toxin [Saprospiraceae bacterium]